MKIAYCMLYTEKNYEELTENIDQLLDGGDDVYVMINDDDLRDDVFIAYVDEPRLHVATRQQSAIPADLSLPRGQIFQMMDALDYELDSENTHYDYFITLTDGMIPLVSKKEMDAFLESLEGKDCYYVQATTDESEELRKRVEEYAFFTNSFDFQKSRMIQGMNNITSSIVKNFKHREVNDTVVLTYPWFILHRNSAIDIVENMEYCSNTFMMCKYAEELALGTMLKKFSSTDHVNKNVWVAGDTGEYQFEKPVKNASLELINQFPDALFATKVHSDTDIQTYQEIFDRYCPIKD